MKEEIKKNTHTITGSLAGLNAFIRYLERCNSSDEAKEVVAAAKRSVQSIVDAVDKIETAAVG